MALLCLFCQVYGLLHISQLANERVNQVSDYVKEGQDVRVKVIEADDKGRLRLSMKALLNEEKDKPADSEKNEVEVGGVGRFLLL